MNAINQENEKNRKDNKPLTLKEKKKLEKSKKEIWQFVGKKLISDQLFCNKAKKKKLKGADDLKEKADKCAVRLGLKLEKSGFSETRLWLMLKDNEKGIVGFYDELTAAVINGTIESDLEARKPKDRLDAELLKDGTVFKYIGQYIQANPSPGRSASNPSPLPTTGDLQSILQAVEHNEPEPAEPSEAESVWDAALRSFAPFKQYLQSQTVPAEVVEAYALTLVLSGFNYTSMTECVTNFQPPEPENPGEPPETVYGHLLGCLREISFEKYPRLLTENIDGHTVSIVRFALDHCSKPRTPSPAPACPVQLDQPDSRKTSPVPGEEAVPVGGNTSSQLPRKKYVTVSVSVDTIPVETGLAVWQVRHDYFYSLVSIVPHHWNFITCSQVCLHTPGLPDEQDPDFECMMVPSGVGEARLHEAGFMFNQEKGVWYHQGTEFGRRKAEAEEKSVEKLVSYLEVSVKSMFVAVVNCCPCAGVTSWRSRCRSQQRSRSPFRVRGGLRSGAQPPVRLQRGYLVRHGAGRGLHRPLQPAGRAGRHILPALLQGGAGRGEQVAEHADQGGRGGRGAAPGAGGGRNPSRDGVQHPV